MSSKKWPRYLTYLFLCLVVFFAGANVASELILSGELVSLPNLIGKPVEAARAELAARKVALDIQGAAFDSRYEKGRVILQDPAEGSRINPRRSVKVVVSQGSEQVSVPACEGRSLEWTAGAFKEAGLRRGHASQIHTSTHAAGRVIAQDPPAGTVTARATPVDMLVSQGEWEARYMMPDLIGKRAQPVLRRLRDLGFRVTEVSYAYYPGQDPGVILKQTPIHGQQILKRNEITLEVSR
ncbi:MAG: PASTA domain-containing protein [Candidatus Aminicenantes bacterium]|nr:PASTA domain-containing protein [Candidatus Aminicenantes bacterium]